MEIALPKDRFLVNNDVHNLWLNKGYQSPSSLRANIIQPSKPRDLAHQQQNVEQNTAQTRRQNRNPPFSAYSNSRPGCYFHRDNNWLYESFNIKPALFEQEMQSIRDYGKDSIRPVGIGKTENELAEEARQVEQSVNNSHVMEPRSEVHQAREEDEDMPQVDLDEDVREQSSFDYDDEEVDQGFMVNPDASDMSASLHASRFYDISQAPLEGEGEEMIIEEL